MGTDPGTGTDPEMGTDAEMGSDLGTGTDLEMGPGPDRDWRVKDEKICNGTGCRHD